MLDELRRMDWVPRTVHEKSRKIQQVIGQLEQRLGRVPTDEEMAAAMKISLAAYREMLDEIRPAQFICLDSVSTSDGDEAGSLYEVIPNPNQEGPMEQVSQTELKQLVFERLETTAGNPAQGAGALLRRGFAPARNRGGVRPDRIAHLPDSFAGDSFHPFPFAAG